MDSCESAVCSEAIERKFLQLDRPTKDQFCLGATIVNAVNTQKVTAARTMSIDYLLDAVCTMYANDIECTMRARI